MTEKLNASTPPLDKISDKTSDEIPELDDTFFLRADVYQGEKLIKKGRPKQTTHKKSTTIRFDPMVLEYFKSQGAGWQTKINAVLKDYIKSNPI